MAPPASSPAFAAPVVVASRWCASSTSCTSRAPSAAPSAAPLCARRPRAAAMCAGGPAGGGPAGGGPAGGGQAPRPPRTKIGLLRALLRAGVASRDTCETLLRVGHVRVNGLVKEDASMRVDLLEDVVTVSGKDLDFGDAAGDGGKSGVSHVNDYSDREVEGDLTRAQRDFRKGKFAETGRAPREKKFSRRVDAGFLSRREWNAGK